ncbi:MAG TPA: CHAD domain-containing protein [Terriglobales bacterium]|nr:CHAD domain-containing protein [Terriglobales bacterium]
MPAEAVPAAAPEKKDRKSGLSYWMHEVLKESKKARAEFAADPVHDLRVAIRRCRSLAEGFQSVDPNPDWKKMRRVGKEVFAALGTLRDVQVLIEWVEKLGSAGDPATQRLLAHCRQQEQINKTHAAEVLAGFDAKQWQAWAISLPKRTARLKPGSEVFQEMALERWAAARELHRTALRSRSKVALHRLRIGFKKLRYLVENFLPSFHDRWGTDLKELQDLLGEVHDLDVLWETAIRIRAFATSDERVHWQKKISETRDILVQRYRAKMVGPGSLWEVWRAQLPQGAQLDHAILTRLRLWSSFRDPDFQHSKRVTTLATQLYDGLAQAGALDANGDRSRTLLKAAALMHDVGRFKGEQSHHKSSGRMIQRLKPPFGWTADDLSVVSATARFHRGSLPGSQKRFQALSDEVRATVRRLAGILRLADALDPQHDGQVRRLQVRRYGEYVIVYAEGFQPHTKNAERMAAARYLLEETCGMPVLVRNLASAPRTSAEKR